jgi:hypothetical protein
MDWLNSVVAPLQKGGSTYSYAGWSSPPSGCVLDCAEVRQLEWVFMETSVHKLRGQIICICPPVSLAMAVFSAKHSGQEYG